MLGLGIEFVIFNTTVINAIFFTTSYAQLDLDRHTQLVHALKVFFRDLDVLMNWLFREVQHVGAVQGLASLFFEGFTGIQQTVDPWQPFFGSMVSMQYYRYTIVFSNLMYVFCTGNTTGNVCLQLVIRHSLTGKELCTAIRKLNNYR